MNICVFCASSDLLAPVFYEQARLLGEEIARHSCEVVYGGTNCGLMREVAQAALRAGGKVKGIIPACKRNSCYRINRVGHYIGYERKKTENAGDCRCFSGYAWRMGNFGGNYGSHHVEAIGNT